MQRCFLVPIGKQVAGRANQDSLHQENVVHLLKGIRKTKVYTGWRRRSIEAFSKLIRLRVAFRNLRSHTIGVP